MMNAQFIKYRKHYYNNTTHISQICDTVVCYFDELAVQPLFY